MEHFDNFFKNVRSCIEEAINVAKTFQENSNMSAGTRSISGSQVLGPLAVVLLQCLTRIKNATAKYPDLRALVHELSQWIDTWVAGVSASPPTFVDPLASCPVQTREQICQHIRRKADQLVAIVDREHSKNTRPKQQDVARISGTSDEGILAALHNSYVGPGVLRPEGMRHDNDHIDIVDIRIAPTHEELICRIPLFLPANLYGAPHPLVANSMERILDIQFRLLREELTASLRTSVQLILDDMESKQPHTQLEKLLERGGGKYKGQSDGRDSVLFNIYTNAQFSEISPGRSGLSVGLSVDTPPGRARAPEAPKRVSFWEGMSGKRLLSGGLVALVWQRKTGTDVHLGTISSSIRDHVTSARQSAERISIRVTFFDPDVELRILQELRRPVHERDGMKVLIEATVMFASVRPFLEALRVEPTTVPFSKYIVHRPHNELCTIPIDPPAYARAPDFAFELASLFSPEAEVESMKLSVSDPESVAVAREELRKRSRLDPSQADAIVDALTRELVLIQGPPGTGKSYTGVELLRVLLANDAGPILMIAFTNHALDHMLCSVLDASITQKIVRLGSRSADERIAKFSIETAEELAGKSRLDRAFAGHHWELKQVEEEFRTLMQDCLKISVDTENILEYIEVALPIHFQDIIDPPEWINLLYKTSKTRSNGEGDWKRVGKGGRDESVEDTVYGYWLAARDLGFLEEVQLRPDADLNNSIQPQAPTTKNHFEVLVDDAGDTSNMMSVGSSDIEDMDSFDVGDVPPEEAWMFVEDEPISPQESDADLASNTGEKDAEINPDPAPSQDAPSSSLSPSSVRPSDFDDLQAFFRFFGYSSIPRVATTDRPISMLIELDGIWTMSRQERGRLHEHLVEEVRVSLQETRLQEFKRLRQKHADALNRYNEGKAAARCQLLRNVDIIGCTTTGAANLTALLKAIGPKIMLVEEAGQVLEAHVLGSLVPSIQQLILIGDPLQLRPTLNNYGG
ncbi:hypothetical protein PHLCEN_2v105 [Hermanssonia centrifuga]|uniref:DNA2/NAM7 helicase helicase domain-containing protein n=1 Tax=Hermanssonia centrifuga TaxID=98765 RepID=A0A2R6S6U6_9APHY|nr:hypothetical protein PHLCEN_2v105 [Hermanssonia centrifuga]